MNPEATRRDFLRAGTAATAGLVAGRAGAADGPTKSDGGAAKPARSPSGTRAAGKSARPAKSAATTTSVPSGAASGDGDHE